MTAHHELCPMGADLAHRPRLDLDEMQACQCPIIHAVETLVREQIATAIEALPIDHRSPGRATPTGLVTFVRQEAYWRAARIARVGGSDE